MTLLPSLQLIFYTVRDTAGARRPIALYPSMQAFSHSFFRSCEKSMFYFFSTAANKGLREGLDMRLGLFKQTL